MDDFTTLATTITVVAAAIIVLLNAIEKIATRLSLPGKVKALTQTVAKLTENVGALQQQIELIRQANTFLKERQDRHERACLVGKKPSDSES